MYLCDLSYSSNSDSDDDDDFDGISSDSSEEVHDATMWDSSEEEEEEEEEEQEEQEERNGPHNANEENNASEEIVSGWKKANLDPEKLNFIPELSATPLPPCGPSDATKNLKNPGDIFKYILDEQTIQLIANETNR